VAPLFSVLVVRQQREPFGVFVWLMSGEMLERSKLADFPLLIWRLAVVSVYLF
jgi:hypothetical protein